MILSFQNSFTQRETLPLIIGKWLFNQPIWLTKPILGTQSMGICVSQKISRHQYFIQIQDLKKKKKLKSKEFLSNFSKCKQRFYFKGFFLLLLFLFVLNSRTGKVCLWPCNINPQKSYYINLLLFLQNRKIWIKPRLYWINSHQSLPHLFPLQHDHILKNFPFENLWVWYSTSKIKPMKSTMYF